MASSWTYQRNGVEMGPFSSAELKRLAELGGLQPDDLVKRDDMAAYVPASRVKGLFKVVVAVDAVSRGGESVSTLAPRDFSPPPPGPESEQSSPRAICTFGEWYRAQLGHQWLLAQGILWFFYGFIWIPIWWLVTRSSLSKAEAAARANTPRKPILSYAIAGFFAVPFVLGMMQPILDPEGYKASKAQRARDAAETARASSPASTNLPAVETARASSPASTNLPAVKYAVNKIVRDWIDIKERLLSTPRIALGGPISEIQALRRQAEAIPEPFGEGVPPPPDGSPGDLLASYLRANLITALDYEIQGQLEFMGSGGVAGSAYMELSTKYLSKVSEAVTNPQSVVPTYRE